MTDIRRKQIIADAPHHLIGENFRIDDVIKMLDYKTEQTITALVFEDQEGITKFIGADVLWF